MLLVQSLGNSIQLSIEVEVDYPSRHRDGKLPILDLKGWVEKRNRVVHSAQEREVKVVLHEFYYKDVSTRSAVNARSVLPWSCKRTIIKQEVLRVLFNCSRELSWETVVAHVNHMILRLQYSGYDQTFRTDVVRPALNAYTRLIELDASDETPLYRRREWRKLDRAREKRRKGENWYKKGGFDTVIFIPATPGSQLKHRYMKEIKETGFKVRVVEQSETTLKSMVQKSDPFEPKRCAKVDCLVCRADGKGSCRSTGVTYELLCKASCNKNIGETSRSACSFR